jgi:hypothetical protein
LNSPCCAAAPGSPAAFRSGEITGRAAFGASSVSLFVPVINTRPPSKAMSSAVMQTHAVGGETIETILLVRGHRTETVSG